MTKKNKRCEKCTKEKNFGFCDDVSCSNNNFKNKQKLTDTSIPSVWEDDEKGIFEKFLKETPDYIKAHWGVNEESEIFGLLIKTIQQTKQTEREMIIEMIESFLGTEIRKNSLTDIINKIKEL